MTRRLPELLVRHAVVRVHDLVEHLRDLYAIRLRHRHEVVLHRQPGGRAPAGPVRRIAIVSTFPSASSQPFTTNLLRLLAERDFLTILVSTRPLTDAERAHFAAEVGELVERANAGRDFGSYQWGLRWIAGQPERFAAAEVVLLANDSMFYPRGFGAEIDRMLAEPAPWQCLFETNEIHYHAGSFFLLFRRPVLESAAFRAFWSGYRPYSARRHVVDRGEVGLSAALRAAGLLPGVAYGSVRIAQALQDRDIRLDWLPSGGFPGLRRQDILDAMLRHCPDRDPAILPKAMQAGIVAALAHACETRNPAQVAGLLCNVLFGAPLKRDLSYRGIYDMQQLIRTVEGFDAAERDAMLADLRTRGVASGLGRVARILADFGRL